MRVAVVVALFVVVCAAGLVGVVAPASGQTVPPTATPTATIECHGDCSIAPTPRPTASVSPTPDPGCTDNCGPIATPRPIMGTPAPDCPGECFPWPTPRPTFAPGATIVAAEPPERQTWFYRFMPVVGRQ